MIELPLIFVGGLLGSSHCVGMCGGFAVSIGVESPNIRSNLRRQLAYTVGRVFTYAFAGATAAFVGLQAATFSQSLLNFQAALALVAGCLLVVQGLRSAGLLSRSWFKGSSAGFCPGQSLFAAFLRGPGLTNAFLSGLLTGFLPCGLVYAYLALAASAGSLADGLLTMAVFGAGTAPLMILTGTGASALSLSARRRMLHLAAWCVIVTGVVTTARGATRFWTETPGNEPSCPFCKP